MTEKERQGTSTMEETMRQGDTAPQKATQAPRPKPPLPQKDKRARLLFWLCLALAAACGVTVLYYIWFPSRTVFISDCFDTLYWANASYESGRLFSSDFYYATLQPFGGQLLMLPFIALFGFGLKAHLAGMVVFAMLFMAGLWFFCASLELAIHRKLLLFSGLLLVLSSSFKLRELMWEHVIYYSLAILFACLLMGLCFRLQGQLASKDGKGWEKIVLLVLLFLLCIGVGTDGMQVLVMCTIPLLLALVAERFFDTRAKVLGRRNLTAAILVGVMGVGTAAGLLLLGVLSAGITTSYTELHMVFSPSWEWADHILSLPDFWARLMGFNSFYGQNILTADGLVELLRIFVGLLLVIVPVVAACNYQKLRDRKLRLLLWFHGFLCGILLLSHIVGSTANAEWRFTPAVFSGAVITLLYLMHLWDKTGTKRLAGLLGVAIALLCAVNVGTMLTLPVRNGRNQHFYALAATLQENGLTYGYADFQICQPVTVLSNGAVKARYVYPSEDGIAPFYYQTERKWYDDVPGQEKYFIVLLAGQLEEMQAHVGWQKLAGMVDERIEAEQYEILVFNQNPMNRDEE